MKLTVAHLKRTLTPGTRIRVTNHKRPVASRDTRVHDRTNTVSLVTWGRSLSGEMTGSFVDWPRAKDLRAGDTENVIHIDDEGKPFLTIEVIGDDHPEAPYWPDTARYV